jgi:hypothetical protein
MLFRTNAVNGKPASRALIARARLRFRQRYNGCLLQNSEAFRYLNHRQAKGVCFSADLIFLGRNASLSCLLEELMHALQYRTGRADRLVQQVGNSHAILLCEMQVAKLLTKNALRWRIPPTERLDNLQRYRKLRATIQSIRGLSWVSNSESQMSKSSLVQALESLTGPFWRGA